MSDGSPPSLRQACPDPHCVRSPVFLVVQHPARSCPLFDPAPGLAKFPRLVSPAWLPSSPPPNFDFGSSCELPCGGAPTPVTSLPALAVSSPASSPPTPVTSLPALAGDRCLSYSLLTLYGTLYIFTIKHLLRGVRVNSCVLAFGVPARRTP